MSKHARLLHPEIIPDTLWDHTKQIINLPPILKDTYLKTLRKNELENLALERQPNDSPIGGITQAETDKHFAQAFDGSAARVQLAILDPKNETDGVSNALINSLLGNKLLIVDAPCGAGAASLTLLTTIAELRSKRVLPRIPLEVIFIGAELAEPARKYAEELIKDMACNLEKESIFVTAQFHPWDATSDISTSDLIKNIIRSSSDNPKCLVVIANFSGFLKNNLKKAQPQIQELLRYSEGESSSAIWIEPQRNDVIVTGGIFAQVSKMIINVSQFIQFTMLNRSANNHAITSSKFRRPINSNETPRVNLAVMSLTLKRPYEEE